MGLVSMAIGVAWLIDRVDDPVIDDRAVLARLVTAPETDGAAPVEAANTLEDPSFLRAVVADIQDTWDAIFASSGMDYPRTVLVLFHDQVRSACGPASAQTGPFYCPLDQQVYLDQAFFREMETRLGAPGDFAQAYVIAHEFGHHIQLVVGVAGQVLQSQQARPDLVAALSVRMELQADCLAGVWGYSAYTQEQLEPGDLEEAVTAAAAVGDDRLQRLAGRAVNPDSFTHGTSEQRVAWFLEGFRYGQPERCDTFSRADP
jgi:predicted metalloprotease